MKQSTITVWLSDWQIAWLEDEATSSGASSIEVVAAAELSLAIRDRVAEERSRDVKQQLLRQAEERNDLEAATYYRELLGGEQVPPETRP